MAAIGRRGGAGLDAKIAEAAGIAPDDPNYAARLAAARKAYYIRLGRKGGSARRTPPR